MKIFDAARFVQIATGLGMIEVADVKDAAVGNWNSTLDSLDRSLADVGLELSRSQLERLRENIVDGKPTDEAKHQRHFVELRQRIQDEMKLEFFLHVPRNKADYYAKADSMFGSDATTKWPEITSDIAESGKCFALARFTACVFHLMRVIEFCVQQLGTKLAISFTNEKNWQNILEETNKAIKGLDQKDPNTKQLAAVSSNLYNVKLAWRNEVMHPKATYTEEEAADILVVVKSFLRELVKAI